MRRQHRLERLEEAADEHELWGAPRELAALVGEEPEVIVAEAKRLDAQIALLRATGLTRLQALQAWAEAEGMEAREVIRGMRDMRRELAQAKAPEQAAGQEEAVTALARRLDQLENFLVEQERQIRLVAERTGRPLPEVRRHVRRIDRRLRELQASGLSLEQAIWRRAEEQGMDADTILARVEELCRDQRALWGRLGRRR